MNRFVCGLSVVFWAAASGAVDTELVNDVPQPGTVAAAGEGAVLSATQFVFDVPEGASQVTITLAADNLLQDIDLHVRYADRVEVQNGGTLVSDYFSETVGSGFEVVTISGESDPPLVAGQYFAGVVNYEMQPVPFSITGSHDGTTAGPTETPTVVVDPATATPTVTASPTPSPSVTSTSVPTASPTSGEDMLHRADLDGDETIGHGDLLILIGLWGQTIGN